MQTGLLLCLLPSSDLEKSLNVYRAKLACNFPLILAFPPLLPLCSLAQIPAFHTLRQIANIAWPKTRLAAEPSLQEQGHYTTLGWDLVEPGWGDYQSQVSAIIKQSAMQINDLPAFLPLKPRLFLGFDHYHKTQEPFQPVIAPEEIANPKFYAPILGLIRFQLEIESAADYLGWELLANLRVKKS